MWRSAAGFWRRGLSSLWLLPGLLIIGAVLLSFGLSFVDSTIGPSLWTGVPWPFAGTVGAARALLSVIAGSMITVAAIAYSITIVAIEHASTQFSPRVLRTFTSDRDNQIVLGIFLATFTYALLVMGGTREPIGDQPEFVPGVSVTVAIVLALVSAVMLIHFINHVSQSLQVIPILISIRRELDAEVEGLFPTEWGEGSTDPPDWATLLRQTRAEHRGREAAVRSRASGYLLGIDEGTLIAATPNGVRMVWVWPQVGQYVHPGGVLVRMRLDEALTGPQQAAVRAAFSLGRQRTICQDPLFGIRELADIGIKGMAPGTSFPTTTEQCLAHLGDVVLLLMGREFPSPLRRTESGISFLFNKPDFKEFVRACFDQIRREASIDVHVTMYLLQVLTDLAERAPNRERAASLREQVDGVLSALSAGNFTEQDRQTIREKARAALACLSEDRDPLDDPS